MEFGIEQGDPGALPTGCIVVGVYEGRRLSDPASAVDAASSHALEGVVSRDFEGELGTTLFLHKVAGIAAERVLLVGLGPEREFRETRYGAAVCSAIKALRTTATSEAMICLNELPVNGRGVPWRIEQAVLAVMEGLYRFDQLKSKPPPPNEALQRVSFHLAPGPEASASQAAIDRGVAISAGIKLAKDLGNLPGNICTPAYLADQARELGQGHGFRVEVLERAEIEKLGMGAFLAVARGSAQPPRFIVMEYAGGKPGEAPVVLVGKGLTFDAGGISIKAAHEMDEMKFDMAGAASVFGAMHAAAIMKLPLRIVGIIPATENMPGSDAVKPGDIVRTMSGRTVEILDTDAEGRVVLCDALTYAERYEPAAVIDLGTLTGGIVVALGDVATGMFSNDDALAREVRASADAAWDRVWQMPLWDDYQEALKSKFADLPNIGVAGPDCATTAACFLSRFAQRFPWVHLDIAGTASKSGEDKGATGRPVGLLVHFLDARAHP